MSNVSAAVATGRASGGITKPTRRSLSVPTSKKLLKYFAQRYRLFHLFDEGIQLDEESWYSVTPEKIATHIAERFEGRKVIVDLFSGAGGNAIQFALAGAYVIGVEISAHKITLAKHNARVYGVAEYIDFINADVYTLLPELVPRRNSIDAVFMSPPWGGPSYLERKVFDAVVFAELVKAARAVSEDAAILLPRNTDLDTILMHFGRCEVEKNYLGAKLKTITAYFGGLVANSGSQNSNGTSDAGS